MNQFMQTILLHFFSCSANFLLSKFDFIVYSIEQRFLLFFDLFGRLSFDFSQILQNKIFPPENCTNRFCAVAIRRTNFVYMVAVAVVRNCANGTISISIVKIKTKPKKSKCK